MFVTHILFRYDGPLLQDDNFAKAIEGGPTSPEFTGVIAWLAKQLAVFCQLDVSITPTSCKSFNLMKNLVLEHKICNMFL